MTQPLADFAVAMDRCWQDGRFDDLKDYLDENIVIVAPRGSARIVGIEAAIESYRGFMARAEVERYETGDTIITESGNTAILEYRWSMTWKTEDERHEADGREVLALNRSGNAWKAVWRMQIAD
ncbi:nuclear transport factor 2 family protein [Parasphingopyxis sp.]|uniref:YybH family protein n=1 Tax=Parasphingopyxis sp. TaxID=1920299 RepID=UPI0026197733|nr:nuclear transport factor 2 family protein [Parasphingopyxis sp.]